MIHKCFFPSSAKYKSITSSFQLRSFFQSRHSFSTFKQDKFDVVIVGAGFAGVSAAYHLLNHQVKNLFLSIKTLFDFISEIIFEIFFQNKKISVALIDSRPPFTLTSALSSECYRTFWLDSAMVSLMSR